MSNEYNATTRLSYAVTEYKETVTSRPDCIGTALGTIYNELQSLCQHHGFVIADVIERARAVEGYFWSISPTELESTKASCDYHNIPTAVLRRTATHPNGVVIERALVITENYATGGKQYVKGSLIPLGDVTAPALPRLTATKNLGLEYTIESN